MYFLLAAVARGWRRRADFEFFSLFFCARTTLTRAQNTAVRVYRRGTEKVENQYSLPEKYLWAVLCCGGRWRSV